MLRYTLLLIFWFMAALPLPAAPAARKHDFPSQGKAAACEREMMSTDAAWDRNERGTLDDALLAEDFEWVAPGALPDGWTQIDGDGGYSLWFAALSEWRVVRRDAFAAHSGRKIMLCHFNDQALPNDDWLILPGILAEGTITLRYWAASQDPAYPETFEVRASTAGTQPADFTALIHAETSVPSAWTFYEHDLSGFADTPFYVAFHYISADRFAFKLDDVAIEGTPVNVGWIAGTVTNDSAETVAGARVTIPDLDRRAWTDSTGMYILSLIPAGSYDIEVYHKHHHPYGVMQTTVAVGETTRVDATLSKQLLQFYIHYYGLSPEPIRDFDTSRVWLNVRDTAYVYDVDVTVSVEHPCVGDLEMWLQWVDTTRVSFFSADPYETGAHITNCIFDDDAEYPFTAGEPTYSDRFQPEQSLSILDGDSVTIIRGGIRYRTHWLYVYDRAERDEGFITGFTFRLAVQYAMLRGTVTDANSGLPLENVAVHFENSRRTLDTLTSADGRYLFSPLPIPASLATVRFEREGYQTVTRPANLMAGSPTDLDVELLPVVSAEEPTAPLVFYFNGCYPNPFNAQTRFRFTISQAAPVTITLFNVLGEIAAQPIQGFYTPGIYDIPFSSEGLASGLYLVHLRAGDRQMIRKVMLLK